MPDDLFTTVTNQLSAGIRTRILTDAILALRDYQGDDDEFRMTEHPDWDAIQTRVYAFMPEDGALDRLTDTLPDIIDKALGLSDCSFTIEELLFMDDEHDDWAADEIVIRLDADFEALSTEEEKDQFFDLLRNGSTHPLWRIVSHDIKEWRHAVRQALETGSFWPN